MLTYLKVVFFHDQSKSKCSLEKFSVTCFCLSCADPSGCGFGGMRDLCCFCLELLCSLLQG